MAIIFDEVTHEEHDRFEVRSTQIGWACYYTLIGLMGTALLLGLIAATVAYFEGDVTGLWLLTFYAVSVVGSLLIANVPSEHGKLEWTEVGYRAIGWGLIPLILTTLYLTNRETTYEQKERGETLYIMNDGTVPQLGDRNIPRGLFWPTGGQIQKTMVYIYEGSQEVQGVRANTKSKVILRLKPSPSLQAVVSQQMEQCQQCRFSSIEERLWYSAKNSIADGALKRAIGSKAIEMVGQKIPMPGDWLEPAHLTETTFTITSPRFW